jgi:hypothetical protein
VHALAKRLQYVHLDLFKATSADEARRLSTTLRWLKSTDGLYIIEVPLHLKKTRQLTQ